MANFEIAGLKARVEGFMAGLKKMCAEHYAKSYGASDAPEFSLDMGVKYIRVVRGRPGSKSVHCFINREDGAVLKAASWKAPAKHPRSNVFDADYGLSGVGPFGAIYLRG